MGKNMTFNRKEEKHKFDRRDLGFDSYNRKDYWCEEKFVDVDKNWILKQKIWI